MENQRTNLSFAECVLVFAVFTVAVDTVKEVIWRRQVRKMEEARLAVLRSGKATEAEKNFDSEVQKEVLKGHKEDVKKWYQRWF